MSVTPISTGRLQLGWRIAVGLAIWSVTLLVWEHYYQGLFDPVFDLCSINNSLGCWETLTHPRASLFGLPVSLYALAFYLVLCNLGPATWHRKSCRLLSGGGIIFLILVSAYYLFLMERDFTTVCPLCLVAHLCHFMLFWVLLAGFKKCSMVREEEGKRFKILCLLPAFILLVAGAIVEQGMARANNTRSLERQIANQELMNAILDNSHDRFFPAGEKNFIGGKKDAPYQMLIIGSLSCSHCRQLLAEVRRLPQRILDQTEILFLPYPLSSGCNQRVSPELIKNERCLLAEKTMQAQVEGNFWKWYDNVAAAPGREQRTLRPEADKRAEWSRSLIETITAVNETKLAGIPKILWQGTPLPSLFGNLPLKDLIELLLRYETLQLERTMVDHCGQC